MTLQYALLWSQSQNAVHVEPLEQHMHINRVACHFDRPGDYRLLFVGSREEVDAAAERLRQGLLARADRLVCTRCGREGHRASQCRLRTAETNPAHACAPSTQDA